MGDVQLSDINETKCTREEVIDYDDGISDFNILCCLEKRFPMAKTKFLTITGQLRDKDCKTYLFVGFGPNQCLEKGAPLVQRLLPGNSLSRHLFKRPQSDSTRYKNLI